MKQLNNKYFLLRHAQSLSNVQHVVVSKVDEGINGYPLSEEGEIQAHNVIAEAINLGITAEAIIVSSPFLRTRQTAEILASGLNSPNEILIDNNLMERQMANFHGQNSSIFEKIYKYDELNPRQGYEGIESVESVSVRMLSVIKELESGFKDQTIILVSHGDPLNILYTIVNRQTLLGHRDRPFKNAELRPLLD